MPIGTESFTGANGALVHVHNPDFIRHPNYTEDLEIQGNACVNSTTAQTAYIYLVDPPNADYFVEFDVPAHSEGYRGYLGLIARSTNIAQNRFYMLRLRDVTGTLTLQLYRVEGTFTLLASDPLGSSFPGETLRLECNGNDVIVKRNGTQVWSIPDGAITAAGYPGMRLHTNGPASGISVDNFNADSLSTGITGNLAATESGSDTASITGSAFIAGSLAATEVGADSAAFIGSTSVTGTMAAQESGSDSAAITGSVSVSGVLSAQESGSDSASLAGTVAITCTLAAQEIGSDTADFNGTSPASIIGNLAAVEVGSDSASFSGSVLVAGTLSAQEVGQDSANLAGQVHVSGVLNAVESGSDVSAIVGGGPVPIVGTLEAYESGSDTASFLGTVQVVGAMAAQEGASDDSSITGHVHIVGSLGAQESGADVSAISGIAEPLPLPEFCRPTRHEQLAMDSAIRVFGEDMVFPGWSLTVKGLLLNDRQETPMGGFGANMAGYHAKVRCADLGTNQPEQGTAMTVRGSAYKVVSVDPGIHGMTRLTIRRDHG